MYTIKRVVPFLKEEWLTSINTYLKSYDFWNDGILEELETKIAQIYNRKYVLAVNSASNAIFMCLYILSDKKKRKVILPNYGYPAAFKACLCLGLDIEPIDINENTLGMNIKILKNSIDSSTLAVVHIENNGVMGEIEEIKESVPESIIFLEDSSPSMLQSINGSRQAGAYGDMSIFSFGPTKPIFAGEGAVIMTDDYDIYKKLKLLRHTPNYENKEQSLNFLLSPLLAAYIMPQLDHIQEISKIRTSIHNEYKKYINIFEEPNITKNYGAIMYLSDHAAKISEKLNTFGIEHRYKYYPVYDENLIKFPISNMVRNKIIDLPMHHQLTNEQIRSICSIIRRIESD